MSAEESKRNRTVFLVLLALSHNPMHGYEISKFIEAKSRGFFRVPFGSLYPVLHRLESQQMITAVWEALESEKPKKIYALTGSGRKALAVEVDSFRSLSGAIDLLTPEGV
ncbi:MAG: helix-turn-helix transcriptional regulator [Bdellovibrionia bacterium]